MRATKKSGDGGGASGAAASGISAAVHCRNSGGVARRVTALCDAELLGRVLESAGGDGGCTLDLEKYRKFYSGEVVSEDEAALIASQADNLNVVGEKSLAAARRAFAINPKNVKRVGGVPHAQVYRM